jgi:hypothetical protein
VYAITDCQEEYRYGENCSMIQMTTEAATLIVGIVSGSGAAAIGALTMQNQIDNNTLVPLGILLSGVAVSATLAWKAATNAAKTKAKLEELERRVKEMEDGSCDG